MSAHVLLNLLNESRKKDTMRGLSFISLQDATSYDNYAFFHTCTVVTKMRYNRTIQFFFKTCK